MITFVSKVQSQGLIILGWYLLQFKDIPVECFELQLHAKHAQPHFYPQQIIYRKAHSTRNQQRQRMQLLTERFLPAIW